MRDLLGLMMGSSLSSVISVISIDQFTLIILYADDLLFLEDRFWTSIEHPSTRTSRHAFHCWKGRTVRDGPKKIVYKISREQRTKLPPADSDPDVPSGSFLSTTWSHKPYDSGVPLIFNRSMIGAQNVDSSTKYCPKQFVLLLLVTWTKLRV